MEDAKNNKFNALTPYVLDKNKDIYTEALDYAFSNSDIKNIAITGIYGAGKSTVWKTYVKHKGLNNVITVSLGKYEDSKVVADNSVNNSNSSENNNSDDNKNDDNKSTDSLGNTSYKDNLDINNRIERQLINQMLSQVKADKIPLSKYKFKENKSEKKIWTQIVATLSFVMSILLWVLREPVIEVLKERFTKFQSIHLLYGCVILFLLPLMYFFYYFYKENRLKLSKINLKGAEANLKEDNNDDETILDRDIKEIVYLLRSSGTEIVVFEDLDRYDNISIFTKLRELNFLLNSYMATNDSEKVIRFIYMLKDGLFFSKNRAKFFDFILPIVPVVDSKNSENKLIELLAKVENAPDKKMLAKISLYVDDMRLLKNIVNEYIVYANIIAVKELDLDKSKLFALITLKNIFPNEFDLLQEDKGYIHNVFDKVEKYRNTVHTMLETKLKEIEEKIDFIKNRIENDKFEAMALMIPAYVRLYNQENKTWAEFLKDWSNNRGKNVDISYSGGSSYFTYDDFVKRYVANTEEKQELLNKMPIIKKSSLDNLYSESQIVKEKIRRHVIFSLKELISAMEIEDREQLFLDGNYEIIKSHYFPLIRFLIADGLIDETYWYYKGCFYSGSLKKNDIIYMKNLLEGKGQDVFLEIETPSEIISRLDDVDFYRFNILNKKIFEQCLFNDDNEKVLAITNSVSSNDNIIKLVKIIENLKFELTKKYVSILAKNNMDFLSEILDCCTLQSDIAFKNMLISICIDGDITSDKLQLFSIYIEQNENIISYIDEMDLTVFFENIDSANIKFENLSEANISLDRLKKVEKLQAYRLDIQNSIFIAQTILDKEIEYGYLLSAIYEDDELSATKEYIEEYFKQFIIQYIDSNDEKNKFRNSEEILIKILKSDISMNYKLEYLANNKTMITDIEKLKSLSDYKEVFNNLFEGDKIEFVASNINVYWNMIKSYGTGFIDYIDRNISDENSAEILKNNKSLCNSFVNDSDISNKLFEYTLQFADEMIESLDENLPEVRVCKLIQKNLVSLTDENIKLLLSKSYNKAIVILAENDNTEKVINKLLSSDMEEIDLNLIYSLANSNVTEENVIKLIDVIDEDILIENINQGKKAILECIFEKKLSDANIKYICNNFNEFSLKEKFIISLEKRGILADLDNEYLSDEVMLYTLSLDSVSLDTKIQLIITTIKNKINTKDVSKYIESVKEIKEMADVWNNKYPDIDNSYKEMISEALVKSGYVTLRKDNKIMINRSRRKNLLENHLL